MLNEAPNIAKLFEAGLNRHGFAFQNAVIRECKRLFDAVQSPWVFEAAEFPVRVQGRDTRIDFIMRGGEIMFGRFRLYQTPFYMVAECKRANPSLSNWCFARAPFLSRRGQSDASRFIVECMQVNKPSDHHEVYVKSGGAVLRHGENGYQIGIPIRTEKKGESTGTQRSVIEDAATQVCTGVNGLIEHLCHGLQCEHGRKPSKSPLPSRIVVMPVILTTARLFVTRADLSEADLRTGNVDLQAKSVEERPWVQFQYHTSIGLKHSQGARPDPTDFSSTLNAEYIRSIPIVNAAGIEEFLTGIRFDLDDLKYLF